MKQQSSIHWGCMPGASGARRRLLIRLSHPGNEMRCVWLSPDGFWIQYDMFSYASADASSGIIDVRNHLFWWVYMLSSLLRHFCAHCCNSLNILQLCSDQSHAIFKLLVLSDEQPVFIAKRPLLEGIFIVATRLHVGLIQLWGIFVCWALAHACNPCSHMDKVRQKQLQWGYSLQPSPTNLHMFLIILIHFEQLDLEFELPLPFGVDL